MALFLKKNRADILRQALAKVQKNTPVTAIGAGSVARAFVESITGELGDLYDILDFSVSQSVISSASGTSLDLIGQLYNVQRRTVGDLVQTDRRLGSFYFYIDTPYLADLLIPKGTRIFTANDSFVAQQLSFITTDNVTIPKGRVKAYASIVPEFDSSVFTAGVNTLVQHNFMPPFGVSLKCTNPKPIVSQLAYEDDNNYRIRIIKSIRVAASGTVDAIRFSALGVSGVRDIKVIDTSFGLGSLEVVVVPETKQVDSLLLDQVLQAVNKVRPVGINLYMRQPDYLSVDIAVNLFLSQQPANEAELVRRRANVSIIRYLNTLLPGDTLVYNKMLQYIFDSSNTVQDFQIIRYAPNGVEAVRKNFIPLKDQMIVPGNIDVTSINQ